MIKEKYRTLPGNPWQEHVSDDYPHWHGANAIWALAHELRVANLIALGETETARKMMGKEK